jgi:hypothetical protein
VALVRARSPLPTPQPRRRHRLSTPEARPVEAARLALATRAPQAEAETLRSQMLGAQRAARAVPVVEVVKVARVVPAVAVPAVELAPR